MHASAGNAGPFSTSCTYKSRILYCFWHGHPPQKHKHAHTLSHTLWDKTKRHYVSNGGESWNSALWLVDPFRWRFTGVMTREEDSVVVSHRLISNRDPPSSAVLFLLTILLSFPPFLSSILLSSAPLSPPLLYSPPSSFPLLSSILISSPTLSPHSLSSSLPPLHCPPLLLTFGWSCLLWPPWFTGLGLAFGSGWQAYPCPCVSLPHTVVVWWGGGIIKVTKTVRQRSEVAWGSYGSLRQAHICVDRGHVCVVCVCVCVWEAKRVKTTPRCRRVRHLNQCKIQHFSGIVFCYGVRFADLDVQFFTQLFLSSTTV